MSDNMQREFGQLESNVKNLERRIDRFEEHTDSWRKDVIHRMDEFSQQLANLRGEIRSFAHEIAMENHHRIEEVNHRIDNLHPLLSKSKADRIDTTKVLFYLAIIIGGAVGAYFNADAALLAKVIP